jgi:putative nucleotidyltransferase with HDIG domain
MLDGERSRERDVPESGGGERDAGEPRPASLGDPLLDDDLGLTADEPSSVEVLLREIEKLGEMSGGDPESDVFLSEVLSTLARHTGSAQAVLSLVDPAPGTLEVKAFFGFGQDPPQDLNYIHDGIHGWVYKIRTPISIIEPRQHVQIPLLPFEQTALLAAPLHVGNERVGAISVLRPTREEGYSEVDALLVSVVSSYVGALIGHARALASGQEAVQKTLESLTLALDARDPYTRGHSQRVAMYSLAIANELESDGQYSFVKDLRNSLLMAALLHDVGKIGIRDEILLKPGKLTSEEYEIVKSHPVKGAEIVRMIPGLDEHVIAGILEHHERWDGKGYPSGVTGEKIHIFGRILGLADAFDAIVTSRPYKTAGSFAHALQRVQDLAGISFDPAVVRAMMRAFRDRSVWSELGSISRGKAGVTPESALPKSAEADRTLRRIFGRSVTDLPTLPHVVSQVLEKTRDADSNLADVVKLISTDQSLVSTYLRLVNSAFYGFSRRITTLKQAITLLGFRSVRNVIVNAGVVGVFRRRSFNNYYRHRLWEHALACAVGARIVAGRIEYSAREEAFTAGLLHDIGKVVIDQYAPRDSTAIMRRVEAGEEARAAEKEILGVDHTEVGSWVAERWHLPRSLCSVIRDHHEPGNPESDADRELLKLVIVGNALAKIRPADNPEMVEKEVDAFVRSPQNLHEFKANETFDLLTQMWEDKREAMRVFGPGGAAGRSRRISELQDESESAGEEGATQGRGGTATDGAGQRAAASGETAGEPQRSERAQRPAPPPRRRIGQGLARRPKWRRPGS